MFVLLLILGMALCLVGGYLFGDEDYVPGIFLWMIGFTCNFIASINLFQ